MFWLCIFQAICSFAFTFTWICMLYIVFLFRIYILNLLLGNPIYICINIFLCMRFIIFTFYFLNIIWHYFAFCILQLWSECLSVHNVLFYYKEKCNSSSAAYECYVYFKARIIHLSSLIWDGPLSCHFLHSILLNCNNVNKLNRIYIVHVSTVFIMYNAYFSC